MVVQGTVAANFGMAIVQHENEGMGMRQYGNEGLQMRQYGNEGGSFSLFRFHILTPMYVGFTNTVNSLYNVKKIVYDEKMLWF